MSIQVGDICHIDGIVVRITRVAGNRADCMRYKNGQMTHPRDAREYTPLRHPERWRALIEKRAKNREFKVGDRVRVIKHPSRKVFANQFVGRIGTIVRLPASKEQDCVHLQFADGALDFGLPCELEHA